MSSVHASTPTRPEQALCQPDLFARHILGQDTWGLQADILRAVAESRRVAVKSCHSSGKTFTAADAVLWWISRYRDGIAVTTAPTWVQVEKLLWGEIHKAHRASRPPIGGELLATELRLGPQNYALGLSTDQGVRFQGFHAAHVLIVLDEAPGVRPDVWEAIEGIRAGGDVHVLAIGNPTEPSGAFYDAFHTQRAAWQTFTISAFDTPNLQGVTLQRLLTMDDDELGANERPYLVTRRWVREKYAEWGPESDLWRVRVLGEFPQQGSDSLIQLLWVEQAHQRQLVAGGLLEAGLDVARHGDDKSALCLRRGGRVVLEREWHIPDLMQVVGAVNAELAPVRQELHALKVDVIGIGWGVADRLREQGWPVVDVDVAAPATVAMDGSIRFLNRRAEYYWNLRELLRQGQVSGPIHEQTQAELVSVKYAIDSSGRIVIEKKEDAKKRGVPSPNRGDAMMLAFAPVRLLNKVGSRVAVAVRRGH